METISDGKVMETVLDQKTEIPYVLSTGDELTARIMHVEFSAQGLSQRELAVLDLLCYAVDCINGIYARQQHQDTVAMYKALESLEKGRHISDASLREKVADFITLLAVRNSPWNYNGKGFKFPLSPSQIPIGHAVHNFAMLLFDQKPPSLGRGLYPEGITKEEFDTIGLNADVANSSVVKNGTGQLEVILHERRYRDQVMRMLGPLARAAGTTQNSALRKYIEAKIAELKFGTGQLRKESELAWLENDGSIDFVIDTGSETYFDRFKGLRGMAQGAAYVLNKEYNSIVSILLSLLPELEATAPWKHKKTVNNANLPKLRYVDVLNWAGIYDFFPLTVSAQSLPNNKEFVDRYGSVNLMFVNVMKAKAKSGRKSLIHDNFFRQEEMAKYGPSMAPIYITMVALHELGHTTGDTMLKTDKQIYFGEEYHRFEEARAELFSMWGLPILVTKGIISEIDEIAGYYSMLSDIFSNMGEDPNGHAGARNMMFHYFIKHGAVQELQNAGTLRYMVVPDKMRKAVSSMLGEIGDIVAEGDKEKLEMFKSEYLSTARQQEYRKRLEKATAGIGFIFPRLEYAGSAYTGNLIYPATFRDQRRTLRFAS